MSQFVEGCVGADAEPCLPEPMSEQVWRGLSGQITEGVKKTLLKRHITSVLIPNQVFLPPAHSALREHQPCLLPAIRRNQRLRLGPVVPLRSSILQRLWPRSIN